MAAKLGLFVEHERELIHDAASNDRDVAFLTNLLDKGIYGGVDSIDNKGRTPLHIAALHGSSECALLLLKREADPNAISGLEDNCSTPLHHAVEKGNIKCLKVLLEYEAELELTNKSGQTALDIAKKKKYHEIYRYLIDVQDQQRHDYEEAQREELYDVVVYGNYEEAKNIIEGFPLGIRSQVMNRFYRGPNTLLYRASYKGYKDIVELLLDNGADGRQNLDTGISPLYAAVLAGQLPVVQILSERIPHLRTLRTTKDLTEPIHIAALKGYVKIVKYLLQFRGPILPAGTEGGNSASEQEPGNISGCYIKVNTCDHNNSTPLHLASRHGHKDVVQELLKCGPIVKGDVTVFPPDKVVIDCRTYLGWTPLLLATGQGYTKVVEVLLKNGADVNVMTNDGCTALQIACRLNDEALVQLLLDCGARDIDELAKTESIRKGKDNLTLILLSTGVYCDTTYRASLTAEEQLLDLSPVLVAWHNRKLNVLKEKWIMESVLARNRHAHHLIHNNQVLKMKLITRINLANNELTEVPLIIFQLPSLQTLDLSNNKLDNLPEPPDQGKESQEKDVEEESSPAGESSEDQNPGAKWKCERLEVLEMQNNNLTSIPECVFRLKSLFQLDVSCNQIISLPYEMWLAPKLKSFLVSGNKIRCLPSFPEDFDGTLLNSGAFVRSVSSSVYGSSQGSAYSFAEELPQPSQPLPTSRISNRRPTWEEDEDSSDQEDGNDISDEKDGLDRLDISNNSLYALPPGLACLAPNLTRLNASGNCISDVGGTWALPALLSLLDLSNNLLARFDLSNRQPGVDRTCYSVHRHSHQPLNRAASFPQNIAQQSSLKMKLCKHRSHRALLHLRQLSLTNNKLDQLPLVTGPNIRQPGVTELLFPALQSLGLAHNKFREVPLHIGKLEKLGSLLLNNNKIECLPPELGQCSGLYELKIHDLSLRYPPRHVLERKLLTGQMDVVYITGFLNSVYENSKPYPHIKLMLVGLGNIGKTSLLELLRKEGSGSYQLPGYQPGFHRRKHTSSDKAAASSSDRNVSTVGVEVCDWTYSKKQFMYTVAGPEIKFSTWDFGGQHEYYATHTCFLSRRALYLLLWKMTEGEKGIDQLEPWLLNIQSRAGDAPVIIVGTHYDKLSPHQKKKGGHVEKLQQMILARYISKELGGGVVTLAEKGLPRVLRSIEVSCKTEHNIRELRNIVYDTVLEMKNEDQESLLESLVPASYIRVEEAVSKVARKLEQDEKYPVLEDKQFRAYVEAELKKKGFQLTRSEELDQAVKFLHGYGVMLHYEDPSLKDLYFVDPQWLCDMLAHVITVPDVNNFIRNGILKINDLRSQIFRGERFPSAWVDKYIDLMSKFEVAIKISEKYLLVPSLLPEKQKDCMRVSESVYPEVRNVMDGYAYLKHKVYRRQYLMAYIPSGFWARLITRLIADNRICRIVTMCCEIVNSRATNEEEQKSEGDQLIRAAPPEWACWRTGIELSCFGAKLLRVCQIEKGLTFFGASHKSNKPIFVNFKVHDPLQAYTIEILAPCIGLEVERFVAASKNNTNQENNRPETIGFRVISVKDQLRTAAQLLAIAVEHMDNLLADWYYNLDSFVTATERKLVQRVAPCPKCLRDAISTDPMAQADIKDAAPTTQTAVIEKKEEGVTRPKTNATDSTGKEKPGKRRSLKSRRIESVLTQKEGKADTKDIQNPEQNQAKIINGNVSFSKDLPDKFDQSRKDKPNSTDSTSGYSSEGDHSPLHRSSDFKSDSTDSSFSKSVSVECIFAFTFEEGVKRLNITEPMCCTFHGEINLAEIFPDVLYVDLPENLTITPDRLVKERFLAAGSYGSVSKGNLTLLDGRTVTVAIKIPYDTEPGDSAGTTVLRDALKNKRLLGGALTEVSTTMYKSIRQELSILVPVKHDNIIRVLGVAFRPLSMIIEFAPLGSLDQRLRDYRRSGRKLDSYVLQKCCVQVAHAIKYLHHHNIIYRDLKSENVLVWSFPDPSVRTPAHHAVHLKLADYGISRSVAISGTKGLGGTSGFMAPEIVRYFGKESYTFKVDSFSFGSFMYELVALHPPFRDPKGKQANLVNQFVAEGKRPKLTPREKRAPVLFLSLMYRCWTHNQDDRPSFNDIFGLASLKEFPRLSDAFGLGETFKLQCTINSSTVASAGSSDCATSHSVIGSLLWLCGNEKKQSSMYSTPCMTVLSYVDGRRSMLKEIPLKTGIVAACSVGSMVWLATELGAILVYCAFTYRALALGKPINQRFIRAILHSPVSHSVLVAQVDGSVYRYSDKVSSYQHFVSKSDLTVYFTNFSDDSPIRELVPNDVSQGDDRFGSIPIYCLAAVKRHSFRSREGLGETANNVTNASKEDRDKKENEREEQRSTEVKITYELWCGQEMGLITILNVNNLKRIEMVPALPSQARKKSTNISVRYLETLRTYNDNDRDQTSRMSDSKQDMSSDLLSESVWIVLYPGTIVYRWDVNSRTIKSTVDASAYSPQTDLNSYKTSKKTKPLHASIAQITSILVVEKDLYIGTSFGCLIVCDNLTLIPRIVVRCYEEPLAFLMPLKMTSSRREEGKHRNRLILSSGQCCLDRWSRTHARSKKLVLKDSTVLTWLADQWEV